MSPSRQRCNSCQVEMDVVRPPAQCPQCRKWGTFVEVGQKHDLEVHVFSSVPTALDDIEEKEHERISTGIGPVDDVTGGGLVIGSIVLLGGERGIGKSTLAFQLAGAYAACGKKVLYVSGEETIGQVKLSCSRVGVTGKNILIQNETNIEDVLLWVERIDPGLLIIDSIQTLYSPDAGGAPGDAHQVRRCAGRLLLFCKSRKLTTLELCHLTKSGELAGPETLHHLVDVILAFERGEPGAINEDGDEIPKSEDLRYLLCDGKNRYGADSIRGTFRMTPKGLKPQ